MDRISFWCVACRQVVGPAVTTVALLWTLPAFAQVPAWPTPAATPTPEPTRLAPLQPEATPTASPVPEPPQSTPEPTVAPLPVDDPEGEGESGKQEQGEAEAAEDPVEGSKKDEEINPGEVAFTDYRPFDLDDIEQEPFDSKWKNFVYGLRGLGRYSLFDGRVRFRIGGKAQVDGTIGDGDDEFETLYPEIASDIGFRRLAAFAVGRVKKFNFNFAFEFGPDWGISDAWIEGAEGGLEVWGKYLGRLRVGWMNEPFSLERQTSSYNTGFLERSLPVQTIAPGSNIGAMVHNSGPKGRFTWAAGLFSWGQANEGNASNSVLSLTGRGTYLLSYRNKGRDLLHVGVSLSSRSPSGGDTQYRSRPEARFVDYLVDTGKIDAGRISLWGAEVAGVRGPIWFAAEHIESRVSAQLVDDPTFRGSYAQVGWFLTGESKPYRTNSGSFDRLLPIEKYRGGNPFKKKNGGAWELVGRVSRVDLTDGLVEGGELFDFSAALSWYANATTRVEINYIYASPKDRGSANILLLRLQYQPW